MDGGVKDAGTTGMKGILATSRSLASSNPTKSATLKTVWPITLEELGFEQDVADGAARTVDNNALEYLYRYLA